MIRRFNQLESRVVSMSIYGEVFERKKRGSYTSTFFREHVVCRASISL